MAAEYLTGGDDGRGLKSASNLIESVSGLWCRLLTLCKRNGRPGHSRYCIQLPLYSSRLRQNRKRPECMNQQFAADGYQFAPHMRITQWVNALTSHHGFCNRLYPSLAKS